MTAVAVLRRLHDRGAKIAMREFVRRARVLMSRRPQLVECVAAMGSISFIEAHGEHIRPEDYPGAKALADFLDEFDDLYKMSGSGVRFTATGPVVGDW